MRSKFLDLAHWGNKQDETNGSRNGIGNAPSETGKKVPEVIAVATEKVSAGEGRENGESFPGELLSMEDIYRRPESWGLAGAAALTRWWKCCAANTSGDYRRR